jgi:cell division septation protein DedD
VLNRLPRTGPVVEPEQQYAVVLLNEQQLGQFMRRPGMRQVNRGYSVPDVHTRYLRLKRQTAAAAAVLLLIAVGSFLYFMAPQPAMASMFAWRELPEAPTLDTGASFSVTIASLDSSDRAGYAAGRVRTLGFPAFTRVSPGRRQLHQAMVGPYASLDEAERVQRRLTRSGFPVARIFVDETLRNAPRNELQPDVTEGNPNILLIGAPDRLSLVFELPLEPRQVRSRREENVLSLDVGPVSGQVTAQQWSAPDGVHLVERVAIEGIQASETGQFVRAHVSVPEFARANVRSEGRRVYVDLTWPMVAPDVVAPRSAPAAASAAAAPAQAPVSRVVPVVDKRQESEPAGNYDEQLRPLLERLGAAKPFLTSAARSGSPDVLRALDENLSTIESSLRSLRAPSASLDQHQMLLSAIQTARRATDPSYSGDRTVQAREAFVLYDAAVNAGSLITP